MYFGNLLWIDVGLGLLGTVVFFPWKQIINPRHYLSMSVSNIDYSHVKDVVESYIRPLIIFSSKADFRMYFSAIQGTAEFGKLDSVSLNHELISIRPLTVNPHSSGEALFQVPITQQVANMIVNYADKSSDILWQFNLGIHVGIGLGILRRRVYFETQLPPYKQKPKLMDLALLKHLGE